eukprot:5977778-Pyramimonas_sp.AAC.1
MLSTTAYCNRGEMQLSMQLADLFVHRMPTVGSMETPTPTLAYCFVSSQGKANDNGHLEYKGTK